MQHHWFPFGSAALFDFTHSTIVLFCCDSDGKGSIYLFIAATYEKHVLQLHLLTSRQDESTLNYTETRLVFMMFK